MTMNKFQKYTVTIYDDYEHKDYPLGEVSIKARDYDAAEEIAAQMFSGDTWVTVTAGSAADKGGQDDEES